MRVLANQEEILEDVKRVMSMTISELWPKGDLRISTYLAEDMGLYSRNAIYKAFRDWGEILRRIFPHDEIKTRQSSTNPQPPRARTFKVKYQYKKRECLQCSRMFMSWGAANRKCAGCRASFTYVQGIEDGAYAILLPKERTLAE